MTNIDRELDVNISTYEFYINYSVVYYSVTEKRSIYFNNVQYAKVKKKKKKRGRENRNRQYFTTPILNSKLSFPLKKKL